MGSGSSTTAPSESSVPPQTDNAAISARIDQLEAKITTEPAELGIISKACCSPAVEYSPATIPYSRVYLRDALVIHLHSCKLTEVPALEEFQFLVNTVLECPYLKQVELRVKSDFDSVHDEFISEFSRAIARIKEHKSITFVLEVVNNIGFLDFWKKWKDSLLLEVCDSFGQVEYTVEALDYASVHKKCVRTTYMRIQETFDVKALQFVLEGNVRIDSAYLFLDDSSLLTWKKSLEVIQCLARLSDVKEIELSSSYWSANGLNDILYFVAEGCTSIYSITLQISALKVLADEECMTDVERPSRTSIGAVNKLEINTGVFVEVKPTLDFLNLSLKNISIRSLRFKGKLLEAKSSFRLFLQGLKTGLQIFQIERFEPRYNRFSERDLVSGLLEGFDFHKDTLKEIHLYCPSEISSAFPLHLEKLSVTVNESVIESVINRLHKDLRISSLTLYMNLDESLADKAILLVKKVVQNPWITSFCLQVSDLRSKPLFDFENALNFILGKPNLEVLTLRGVFMFPKPYLFDLLAKNKTLEMFEFRDHDSFGKDWKVDSLIKLLDKNKNLVSLKFYLNFAGKEIRDVLRVFDKIEQGNHLAEFYFRDFPASCLPAYQSVWKKAMQTHHSRILILTMMRLLRLMKRPDSLPLFSKSFFRKIIDLL